MTDIKPCTVKGCKFAGYHHHATANNTSYREGAASQCLLNCGRQGGDSGWTATVAPRLTRKALNARIAALEAENADLHAEIGDKKDRLARCELPADVTWSALNVSADGKTIGFVLAARHHFIGFNYNIENSAAGFTTSLADAVQHVRQTYLAAVESGEVAVA